MLNAAKPPVWRAWLLLAVACWLGVAPAAAVTFAPAFSPRGPETRVRDFFPKNGQIAYTLDKAANRLARVSAGDLALKLQRQTSTYNARDRQSGDTYTPNGSTVTGRLSPLASRLSPPASRLRRPARTFTIC